MKNLGSYSAILSVILTFLNVVIANDNCKICGTYKLTSDPKDPTLDEVWKAMGFSDSSRKDLQNSAGIVIEIKKEKSSKTMKIEEAGNKCWKGKKQYLNSVTLGSEFQYVLCDDRKVPATAKLNEEEGKLSFTFKFPDCEVQKVAELQGNNLVHKYSANDKKAEEQFVAVIGGGSPGVLKSLTKAKKGKVDDAEEDKGQSKGTIELLPLEASLR